MIATSSMLTRMSKEGSFISYATQQMMDLPMMHGKVEVNNTTTDQEYICDTQNSPEYLPDGDVVKRALHAVIIGAMKGGTQALHKILISHPRILTASKGHGELHFFSNRGLKRNLPEDSPALKSAFSKTIPRQDLRDGFESILNDREGLNSRRNGTYDITNEQNIDMVGIHSAPIYLLSGRSVPARLMCVAPWTKVIAILRNPIDRAFSHYNFVHDWNKRRKLTFQEFIAEDIRLLKKVGLIQDWSRTGFETFSGSVREFEAWETYVKRAQNKGPVGRGLYAIQLEIWMDEFRKVNKSIEDDLLVLRSEETKDNPKDAFHQSVEFLGLERRRAKHSVIEKDHHKTEYVHNGMSNGTYNMLYDLFEPYNQRLYNLLGEDDWGGVWDDE